MDEKTIDQELIGKEVRMIMKSGFIRKCTIVDYNDKVVKTVTLDGTVSYIPWSSIDRITNIFEGEIYGRKNGRDGKQE